LAQVGEYRPCSLSMVVFVQASRMSMFRRAGVVLSTCLAVSSRASVSSSGNCPTDWYASGSHCYAAFEGPLSWDNAKRSCEDKGAALISIHSQAENDHAIFACGNTRPFAQGCWIGGTDRQQRHKKWIWVDGTAWDWDRWFDHGGGNREPNNDFCSNHRFCTYGQTADCNVLEVSGKLPYKGYWLDTFCTDKQKYICKVKAVTATATATGMSNENETEDDTPAPPPREEPPAVALMKPVDRPAESGLRRLVDEGSDGDVAPGDSIGWDCSAGAANWERGWSEEKKKDCCKTAGVGCTGVSEAESAQPQASTEPPPPPAPPAPPPRAPQPPAEPDVLEAAAGAPPPAPRYEELPPPVPPPPPRIEDPVQAAVPEVEIPVVIESQTAPQATETVGTEDDLYQ